MGSSGHSGTGASLKASPEIGDAPLEVAFSGTGSGRMESVMILDYGDGHTDTTISPIRDFRRTHTFTEAGTYSVQLNSGSYGGQKPAKLTTVARVIIQVR